MVNSEIRGCDGRGSLTRQRDSVEPERIHHGEDVLSEFVDAVEPWRNDRIGCAETAAVHEITRLIEPSCRHNRMNAGCMSRVSTVAAHSDRKTWTGSLLPHSRYAMWKPSFVRA